MAEPSDSWTQGEFWATAGQVIPVLGLALVLEARALAKSWVLDRPVQRRVEAAIVVAIAFALIFAFSDTMAALARAEDFPTWRVAAVAIAMQLSFAVLALNATVTVATRGTMDVGIAIERLVPWSARNRARRLIRRTQKRLPSITSEVDAVIPDAYALLDRAKSDGKKRGLLSATDLTEVQDFLTVATPPATLFKRFADVRGPALSEAVEKYVERPSSARAREVRAARSRVAYRMVALARAHRVEILGLDGYLKDRLAELERRPFSEADRAVLARHLAAASEPGLFPWSPSDPGLTKD